MGLLPDRAPARTAVLLVGLTERMLALERGLRQGTSPVRQAHPGSSRLSSTCWPMPWWPLFAWCAPTGVAWSLATAQPRFSYDASMAKAMASDAADLAARVALQVHGAIGYTWKCDLDFFLKQTWALSRAWADAATHRRLGAGAGGRRLTRAAIRPRSDDPPGPSPARVTRSLHRARHRPARRSTACRPCRFPDLSQSSCQTLWVGYCSTSGPMLRKPPVAGGVLVPGD